MAQVICKTKHGRMQKQIGGVQFFSSEVGHISEEITEEQAEGFLKAEAQFERYVGETVTPKAIPARNGGSSAQRIPPAANPGDRQRAASESDPKF